MASGTSSTVNDSPHVYFAWLDLESGTVRLVAGEKIESDPLTHRGAAGHIRIQTRFRDGISQTVGVRDGGPYWDVSEFDLQPSLKSGVDEALRILRLKYGLPDPDDAINL